MAVLDTNARQWAMGCHLAGFAGFLVPMGSILGPLAVWMMKKQDHEFIDEQGKEAINFQLSMFILEIIAVLLCLIVIGIPMLIFLEVFKLVIMVVAVIRASDGLHHRYPLTMRIVA